MLPFCSIVTMLYNDVRVNKAVLSMHHCFQCLGMSCYCDYASKNLGFPTGAAFRLAPVLAIRKDFEYL